MFFVSCFLLIAVLLAFSRKPAMKRKPVIIGYVGGYRGLGLAHAQRGDTASALEALRTYVAAAPHARDVALIKKRIARLQGK